MSLLVDQSNITDNDFKDLVTIETNKNTLSIEKKGPHAYWYLYLQRGQLPEAFKGAYLSKEEALIDAVKWIRSKDQTIKTILD